MKGISSILVFGLLLTIPAEAQDLPGVWFLNSRGTSEDRPRLAVGGTAQEPPAAPDEVCLAWTWKEPSPEVEIYPGGEAGSFDAAERAWSLDAGGTTISPEGCTAAVPPFPELALGPDGELWFLRSAGDPAASASWAHLLHAVEAAYRQSSPRGEPPLSALTVGTYGRCEIRSVPVDLGTRLDRWLPVELPGRARPSVVGGAVHVDATLEDPPAELVRVRRFLWWVEDPEGQVSCGTARTNTLRLFPIPGPESKDGGDSDSLLTVADVGSQRFDRLDLDPDDWSPRVRAAAPFERADPATLTLDPAGLPEDLCEVPGLDDLCRTNLRVRRRLATAVLDPAADPPWPPERVRALQRSCERALGGRTAVDACTSRTLWNAVAGELVAGFQGDVVVSDQPRIVETWGEEQLTWRLDDPGGFPAAPSRLMVELLDGTRVAIDTEAPREASPSPILRRELLFPALATTAMILSLAALFRSRRPRRSGPSTVELVRLVEAAVESRLRSSPAPSGKEDRGVSDELVRQLEERAAELRRDLEIHAEGLGGVAPEPPPPPEPSEPMTEDERRRLVSGLEAMSELGYWIELLWPVVQEVSGRRLDEIPESLPRPAGEEWRRARKTLEEFSAEDAAAARRTLQALASGNGNARFEDAASAFLDTGGRPPGEIPGDGIAERLKHYLEPFDHPGRLGEVTLALQYLLEAYPVEQLESARRSLLRQGMAEAARSMRLAEDFHDIVARIAAGIGLDYRAVTYYRSRLDQSEYAFVRQQVSPISLTERVGFAASTDPSVVVRLERPFFFQSTNHVYYAGHAHVARG